EASGYDPELDELLQSVRDRAVELGAGRRTAAEGRLELARRRQAVEEQTGRAEILKTRAEAARQAAEEAQRGFEAAEEALQRGSRLNEAQHLREGLVPGEACPVCEQLVTTPPPARRTPEVEAATAAREATREKQRQAEALARQNEDALTGEQAR